MAYKRSTSSFSSKTRYAQKMNNESSVKYDYLIGQINKAYANENPEMPITATSVSIGNGMRETTIVIKLVERDEYHVKLDQDLHKRCGFQVYS